MKDIRKRLHEFEWSRFNELLKKRKQIIDEQILDTLPRCKMLNTSKPSSEANANPKDRSNC